MFSPDSFCSSESLLTDAVAKFHEGKLNSARKRFERIEMKDPMFRIALEELIKITYQQKDWASFFSYAQHYRKFFEINAQNKVYLLEPLALLRHCQNEIVTSLIDRYEAQLEAPPAELSQLRALANTQFKAKPVEPTKNLKMKTRVKGDGLWKTKKASFGKVHPRQLRVEVESLCEERS